jgi:ribulose-bisphosphate carboxylase large chain
MDDYLFRPEVDESKYIIATYDVQSPKLKSAVMAIAIGQSIGNPDVRTERDTPEILENNLAKILCKPDELVSGQGQATARVAYPLVNLDIEQDGITQLICTLMGGQMDIDIIKQCRLMEVQFPEAYSSHFKGPKIGMEEIKRRTGAVGRPLLGGIVKPKTGMTVPQLAELVEELLQGEVDFIKEDEILSNPSFCRFDERVKRVSDLVREYSQKQGREIFYAPCINGDFPYFLDRARFASENGVNAVHLNIWAGLPAYKALRDLDMPNTAIFFQKSGDRVITGKNNPFGIEWSVICQLARMSGADFIHAGMWGGYLSDPKEELDRVMAALTHGNHFRQTVPSLSCGSNPGLVDTTVRNYGEGLLMNVGGAIQGHPMGTVAGARAMRQAMSKPLNKDIHSYMQDKPELTAAIQKWGYSNE